MPHHSVDLGSFHAYPCRWHEKSVRTASVCLSPKETRCLSSYSCDASYRFYVRNVLPVTVTMWRREKVVLIFVRCRRLLGVVIAKNPALFQCILIVVQSTWQSLVTTMRFLLCHRKNQRVSRVKRLAGYTIGLPAVLNGHRKKTRLKYVPNTKLNGHKKMGSCPNVGRTLR